MNHSFPVRIAARQESPARCGVLATLSRSLIAALVAGAGLAPAAHAATPAQLLADYSAQAGAAAVPARGQQLFTTRHGREWSCSSCHGAVPTQAGQHAGTGKPIAALAPAFNAGTLHRRREDGEVVSPQLQRRRRPRVQRRREGRRTELADDAQALTASPPTNLFRRNNPCPNDPSCRLRARCAACSPASPWAPPWPTTAGA